MIEPVQLHDGDTLVFKKDQDAVLQKCCRCGLWHVIRIEGHENDIRFTFYRLNGEPDPKEFEYIGTEILTDKAEECKT
jgi:hypothetical protein